MLFQDVAPAYLTDVKPYCSVFMRQETVIFDSLPSVILVNISK